MTKQERMRARAETAFNQTCFIAGARASTDPVAAMWAALACAIYAGKEDHVISFKQAAFGSEVGEVELWPAAKTTATEFAQKAVALAEKDSPAARLAARILDQAEALDRTKVPQTRSERIVGGYPAAVLPHPTDMVLAGTRLTHEEFLEAAKQLPEHQLLSESSFAEIPPVDGDIHWKVPAAVALSGLLIAAFLCRDGFTWWALIPGVVSLGAFAALKEAFSR